MENPIDFIRKNFSRVSTDMDGIPAVYIGDDEYLIEADEALVFAHSDENADFAIQETLAGATAELLQKTAAKVEEYMRDGLRMARDIERAHRPPVFTPDPLDDEEPGPDFLGENPFLPPLDE